MTKKIFLFISFFSLIAFSFPLEEVMPTLDFILELIAKIIFPVSLLYYVNNTLPKQRKMFNAIDALIFLFFLLLTIVTAVNGIRLALVLATYRYLLIFRLLLFSSAEEIDRVALKMLNSAFLFALFLNMMQTIFAPDMFGKEGESYIYLLASNSNQFGGVFVPAIMVSILNQYVNNIRCYPMFIICIGTAIAVLSMTTLVSLSVIIIALIFIKSKFVEKNMLIVISITLPLFFLIYILQLADLGSDSFVGGFTQLIGKDLTFTNRTFAWAATIEYLPKVPFYGLGNFPNDWFFNTIYWVANAHNIILNMILKTGYLGLIIFSLTVYKIIRRVRCLKYKNLCKFLLIISLMYLWMNMFEVYTYMYIFLFLYLLSSSANLLNQHMTAKYAKKLGRTEK